MMDDWIIAIIALSFNTITYVYSSKFTNRHKEYREMVNKKIVSKYKTRMMEIFSKNKNSPEIENKIDEMSEELGKENKPLKLYKRINQFFMINFIGLGTFIILNLYNEIYNNRLGTNFYNIKNFALLVGMIGFILMSYCIHSLHKTLSDYELGIEN